jgi:UDPglucose--hexose-1-phosphate uridylyltransferase
VWTDRYRELGAREEIAYVFIFENKGEAIGVTLHHPHGQIYGYPFVPPRPRKELEAARAHRERSAPASTATS